MKSEGDESIMNNGKLRSRALGTLEDPDSQSIRHGVLLDLSSVFVAELSKINPRSTLESL